ncbi:MAG: hypothetical protein SFW62_05120 [Alphaproteobacteria bacterium]|nr:hypothetical protein [Alphaproteobacteria bacterium]
MEQAFAEAAHLTIYQRAKRFVRQYLSLEPLGQGEGRYAFRFGALTLDFGLAAGAAAVGWFNAIPAVQYVLGGTAMGMTALALTRQGTVGERADRHRKSFPSVWFMPVMAVGTTCFMSWFGNQTYPRSAAPVDKIVSNEVNRISCTSFIYSNNGEHRLIREDGTELTIKVQPYVYTVTVKADILPNGNQTTQEVYPSVGVRVSGHVYGKDYFGKDTLVPVDKILYLERDDKDEPCRVETSMPRVSLGWVEPHYWSH